jgi:hypothetical protein
VCGRDGNGFVGRRERSVGGDEKGCVKEMGRSVWKGWEGVCGKKGKKCVGGEEMECVEGDEKGCVKGMGTGLCEGGEEVWEGRRRSVWKAWEGVCVKEGKKCGRGGEGVYGRG